MIKHSTQSTDPSNFYNFEQFLLGVENAQFYAISASIDQVIPPSGLLSIDSNRRRVSVDSSVATREPISFYIYGRTNPSANEPVFYAFSTMITVKVDCDSLDLYPITSVVQFT